MAIKEKRGWIWSDEEKKWAKGWRGKILKYHKRVSEQVFRFGKMLPEFAREAADVAKPFLETAKLLLEIDCRNSGRKYQPMSSEDAKSKLDSIEKKLSAWVQFTRRPDVYSAVTNTNRNIKAKKLELKRQEDETRRNLFERLNNEGFFDLQTKETIKASEEIAITAFAIHRLKYKSQAKYDERNQPILQRLVLVHFVRSTFVSFSYRKYEMQEFIAGKTMKETIRQSIYILVKDRILTAPEEFLHAYPPQEEIIALLSSTYDTLMLDLEKLRKENIDLKDIGKGYFTIIGEDYSLEAKPE